MTPRLQLRSTILALAALLALSSSGGAARAASASDAHPGAGGAAAPDNMQLQVFLQRRFRLPSASDVEIGPPKASPIPGMSARIVKMHNDQGQQGTSASTWTPPARPGSSAT